MSTCSFARRCATEPLVDELYEDLTWDVPLRLFGAVHYLELAGIEPYALSGEWDVFRSTLESRRDFLARFVREQAVQTNEVQRCFALLPAFLELLDRTGRDPAERCVAPSRLQQLAQLGPPLGANVAGRGRLEDDGQRVFVALGEHGRQQLHVVAADERRRLAPQDRDRGAQPLRPLDPSRPEERVQQPRLHGLHPHLELRRPLGVRERELELPAVLEPSRNQILALRGEQAELLPLSARGELAQRLQLRIVAGTDHRRQRSQLPWKSQRSRKRRSPPGQSPTSSS